MKTQNVSLISAVLYIGLSLVISFVFFAVSLLGDYAWVARAGGSAWVFILSMIVLMPLVIPNVKKRMHVN